MTQNICVLRSLCSWFIVETIMRNISYDSATYLKQRQGFTIVELLIVVVVIAILASITIVSYNGITKSARNSAVQSTLSQAAQKLEITRMNNADDAYPATLSAAGLNLVNSGDTTYTYAVSSDSKLYCLASSQSGRTYFVTSTIRSPRPGICTGTTGVPGTGEVASDGSSTAPVTPPVTPPVTASSIWNSQTPGSVQAFYTDGGGSLKVGNRFYTTNNNGITVKGLRIYNPASSDSTFLSLPVTAYAYKNDWFGAVVSGNTTFSSTPIATKAYSGTRTAGSWTDILFDTPFTLPKITPSSGATDLLTLAVQFSGGNHYSYITLGSYLYVESTSQPGTYLSEDSDLGRGVNTLSSGSSTAYYGIDLLFSPITP